MKETVVNTTPTNQTTPCAKQITAQNKHLFPSILRSLAHWATLQV